MDRLVYLIAYPLLWLVSRLPFFVVYGISRCTYYWVYYIFRYRRKVVRDNLSLVFPEKSEKEINTIQKKFYKHMCDMFLEMIKTMGISEKELQARFTFTNLEVLEAIEAQNKSVLALFPHYASWEWVISLNALIGFKGYAIYLPVGNKHFDTLVKNIRQKFGTTLITNREAGHIVSSDRKKGVLGIYGVLGDQSPRPNHKTYWAPFMGIKVPVHTGADRLAKRLDLAAVYLKVEKVKRGHYQGTFKLLTDTPETLSEYELTNLFLKEVEKSIREAPEYYFWTHKRWKHRDKAPKQ